MRIRDWSSDVCSSDLKGIITLFSQPTAAAALSGQSNPLHGDFEGRSLQCRRGGRDVFAGPDFALPPGGALLLTRPNASGKWILQIGRASCRARVCQYVWISVGAGS